MNLNVLVLPGDGIGTEVTREAVRVLRARRGEVESPAEAHRGAARRHRDSQDRHAVSRGDRAARGRRRRHPDGRGGPAGIRQCAAREAAGKGTARHSQGAGRLREFAPGSGVRVATGFFSPEEPPGGRHRHDHRPRTDGRDLLRNSARHYRKRRGRAGGQYHDLHARGNRARYPHGLPPGARPPQEGDLGRQVERAGEFAALAARGGRGREGVSGRRARSPAGGQLRDAAGAESASASTSC